LRIAIDVTSLLPEATGVDVYMLRLLEHLGRVDRDDEFRVLVNYEDRHRLDGLLPENFAVVPFSLRPRPARLFSQQIALPLDASIHRVDVIHSPSFIMPWYRGAARHVLTVQDMTFFTCPDAHIPLRRSRLYRRAVCLSIRRADVVVAPSHFTKRSILDQVPGVPPESVHVVPHGVAGGFTTETLADRGETVRRRLGLPPAYLLFVGTVEPRKNLARLLDAYRQLVLSSAPAEHLVMAGRLGWQYDDVLARIDDPVLRGRVHRLGYVDAEDLPAVYRGARLFVYPSLEEGFGLPPVEAMACGIPTISSATSALEGNLRGAARLVDPESVDALADAMRELLSDETERDRLRSLGLQRAAQFDWDASARATLRCYRLAANGQRTGESAPSDCTPAHVEDGEPLCRP